MSENGDVEKDDEPEVELDFDDYEELAEETRVLHEAIEAALLNAGYKCLVAVPLPLREGGDEAVLSMRLLGHSTYLDLKLFGQWLSLVLTAHSREVLGWVTEVADKQASEWLERAEKETKRILEKVEEEKKKRGSNTPVTPEPGVGPV